MTEICQKAADHLREMTRRGFDAMRDPDISVDVAIDVVAIILEAMPPADRSAAGEILVARAIERLAA